MTENKITKVGFVGLGTMGDPMTRNLLKAGFQTFVYNRTASKMKPLVDAGAVACASPAEVGEKSELVFTCVSDVPDVKEVVMGANGISARMAPGGIVVDCSTSSPQLAQEMRDALKPRGIGILDAPVSGGPEGAAQGTLTIMIGGDEDVFQRARPALEAVGKTLTYIGPAGAGQLTKAVNQIVIACSLAGIAEAIILARKSGIDAEKVIAAISKGAARSFMMDVRAPLMLKESFEKAFFALGYHAKDLRIAMEIAKNCAAKIPVCALANDMYQKLDQEGCGKLDHSAVYLYAKKENGL